MSFQTDVPGSANVSQAITQKFSADADDLSLQPLGPGFIYKFDGQTYYSPNCYRPGIELPPPLTSPYEGVIHSDNVYTDWLMPSWWTKAHGYLAFIPLFPDLRSPAFDALLSRPNVVCDQQGALTPEGPIWQRWKDLQAKMIQALNLLTFPFGTPIVRPPYPCARIESQAYRGSKKRAEMNPDLDGANRWFFVWFGCISYAIAVSLQMAEVAKNRGLRRRIPGWMDTLLKPYHDKITREREQAEVERRLPPGYASARPAEEDLVLDPSFVSELANSALARLDRTTERVGTFVKIPEDESVETVSIDWLCKNGVAVWYPWGEREKEIAQRYPFFQRYAPHPEATQVTPVMSQPPCDPPTNPSTNLPGRYPRRQEPEAAERTWEDWFRKRAQIEIELRKKETPEAAQKRENRERCPPRDRKKTSFYVWDKNTEGIFRRRKADDDDLDDLFGTDGKFGRKQARYSGVFNEWDLCDYFGPPDDSQILALAEDEADYMGTSVEQELVKWRTYYGVDVVDEQADSIVAISGDPHMVDPVEDKAIPLDSPTPAQSSRAPQPHALDMERLAAFRESASAREIPELVYTQFGFLGSLPLHTPSDRKPSTDKPPPGAGLTVKILGVAEHASSDASYWRTPAGQEIVAFIHSLGQGSLPRDSCDLFKDSRMPVTSLPRFKLLRRSTVPTEVQVTEWDNVSGRKTVIKVREEDAFWFASDYGQSWRLGCTSAPIALMISRLDASISDPISLAFLLVGQGVRFNTWAERIHPPRHHLSPSGSKHLASLRHESHRFSGEDWSKYLRHRRILLSSSAGRAALLRGGIIWRLALEDVSVSEALSGPSSEAFKKAGIVRHNGQGGYLVDDDLDFDELDAIVGHYDLYLGVDGYGQVGRVSWFPPYDLWEELHGFHGWDTNAENEYRKRLEEIHSNYEPLSRSEWRKRLRQASTHRRLLSTIVHKSRETIISSEQGGL
ncbi:hypothetical protein MD484_g5505, partial [Candolleomyces efflorescens]